MPKRIPTPPPTDDEPRYLTVVHPYAISGTCNMELPKDRQDFARWVACCVDKDAFFAIFHKPSSRGMVIIELNRHYPHFDRILGEHRWSEFLHSPTKEDMGKASKVFYCSYSSGRIVQKNGWKRIDVDESWFKAWSPNNRQIKFPYPQTHFCDVPVEDQTNHSLCRPLPSAVIAPPPIQIVAPRPVVGSPEWTLKKEAPSLASVATQPNPLGVWGKGAPKAAAKPVPPSKKKSLSQGHPAPTRKPAVGGGPIAVKSSNVWQTSAKKPTSPPVAENWEESPQVSRQGTPASSVVSPTGLSIRTTASSLPPGLALPSKSAPSVTPSVPDRTANVSAASWGSNGASTSSPDSDSGPDLTTATESDNPYAVNIHFSPSMEEEFHGMGIRAIDGDDDVDELREFDAIAPGTWGDPMETETWESTASNWDDGPLEAMDMSRQRTETKPICNAHGIICKKGICAEYARQLRLEKRAKEAEERNAAMANKGKKGGKNKGRRGKNNGDDDTTGRPAAQHNNPFRGPGAPVRTNWRGAPRAIVSADTIEQRETKGASDDGWGNSDPEWEPNAAAVVSADAASNASWDVPEGDPWASPKPPAASHVGGKPQSKKKPVSSNWADQVDAELAGGGSDTISVVSTKRGSKRGSAKSSTSGWGSVANADLPW